MRASQEPTEPNPRLRLFVSSSAYDWRRGERDLAQKHQESARLRLPGAPCKALARFEVQTSCELGLTLGLDQP